MAMENEVYVARDDGDEEMPAAGTAASVIADPSLPPPPPGFIVHREASTSILFAIPPHLTESSSYTTTTSSKAGAGAANVFLNPVQEYNRDLSVVAIRTWSERRQREKAAKWEEGARRKVAKKEKGKGKRPADEKDEAGVSKKQKGGDGQAVEADVGPSKQVDESPQAPPAEGSAVTEAVFTAPKFKFTLLEALSATGLRAIRYAKEIPLLRYVVANDLSSSAVQDIKRNIEYNGLAPKGSPATTTTSKEGEVREPVPSPKSGEKVADAAPAATVAPEPQAPPMSKLEREELTLGRVRANEGDAIIKMYNHRSEATRFDCIDLDPYGSAVPFLDAAIGAVADGGLMCITCTDMGVLAGHNYPEKCFTHYGGVCVNAEYSHEVALRLVLNSLATTAAKYGRHIEPMLSLSIDFYVRLFIRVSTSPKEVKALPTKTSLLYYCHNCQSPHMQPFGRVTDKVSPKTGAVNYNYHIPSGPPAGVQGDRCTQCDGKLHIGGPMWGAPIHDKDFVNEMLEHVKEHSTEFGTASRIEGMLTIAKQEIEAPLYFSPTRVASFFHCTSPPLNVVASALLNGGFSVSRSHAMPGSLKTDAPRTFIHDIMREWIKTYPIKMENIKEGSPARKLLSIEQTNAIDLKLHPDVNKATLSDVKLVRYQVNPQANWGPAKGAVKGTKGKKGAE